MKETAGFEGCVGIAKKHADSVDLEARFPEEAFEALKQEMLVSPCAIADGEITLPPVADLMKIVRKISAACSNTGMILAMHYNQLSALVRYSGSSPYLRKLLENIVEEQSLIASSTTERTTGGDTGRSSCSVIDIANGELALEKDASVISYAMNAGTILVTARSHEMAPATEQVLVVCSKRQLALEPSGSWDSLGMRGTDSRGYLLNAKLPKEAILSTPYSQILATEMLPMTHLMWSSVWIGMMDAVARQVRHKLKSSSNEAHKVQLYEMLAQRQQVESLAETVLQDYMADSIQPDFTAQLRANTLKTVASDRLVDVAISALKIIGLTGYMNSTPTSIARVLRDSLSAPLMVGNDRIRSNSANLALVASR